MKKSHHFYSCLILIVFSFNYSLGQQKVSVDGNIPLQELIENHLATSCVNISNVSSSINGSVDGIRSYGAFHRGNSNFPLESGIVIATGSVTSGGNINNNSDLSDGTMNWRTDPDIETFLGISNTVNATSIEFDFIALSDRIQFNYILASEEYFANFPCNASDGFVFLIREASSTGPYQNIAVVPNTGDSVTVNNIHDNIVAAEGCRASNEIYFEGYSIGDTNYNGRTTVLTATTNLIPNVEYHVKLIVADQSNSGIDPSYDTSVFIEANPFLELDLGDDIAICSQNVPLNGEVQNPLAGYTWYRNNTLLSAETNNPILSTSVSGVYRLEVTIDTCVFEDEINVHIDNELRTSPIAPYELCDTSGTGLETFNLSTKNTDVENAIADLPLNYTISYYFTNDDAINNPSNNITTPINTTPRTIYVRIEDTDNGCLIYGDFELVITPMPNFIQPTSLDVCDNDSIPDGRTQIFLDQKDTEITGGNPNLSVSYHYTQADANTGANPIPLPYVNTAPNNLVYIRVVDSTTGCASSNGNTLTINVTNGNTQINRETQFIDACDTDHDGFATFDLTQVLNDILNGATGFLPPTYHTSFSDAESGSTHITNPQSYINTNPNEQIIYIRLVDSVTGCYDIVPIEIHTNLLLTATNIPVPGFYFCDEDNDGIFEVDLNLLGIEIINGLPDITITFYASEANRTNGSPAINPANLFLITNAAPTILYITLESSTCTEVAEFSLEVTQGTSFPPVNTIPYCDDDSDGITMVDFNSFNSAIIGGATGFNLSYYTSATNAVNDINPLPRFYNTASNTFYVRIYTNTSGCYSINSFSINVIPAPLVNNPSDMLVCDNDQDDSVFVNLEDKIPEIVTNTQGLNIHFYESLNNAQTRTNRIPDSEIDNYETGSRIIYVRIEQTTNGCFRIVNFRITINRMHIMPNITPYQICSNSVITSANFDLETKDAEILNGQTGYAVYYFQDSNFSIPIDKTIPYNSSGNETIYVRVERLSDRNCYITTSFNLIVGILPRYNTNFTNFPTVCQITAGSHTFDFESKRQELASGSSDVLDIKFYLTFEEANINASSFLPNVFSTSVRQGQFYARIENTVSACYVIEEVRFITFPTPSIASASITPVCDTQDDFSPTIDLTTAIFQIENVRFGSVIFSFYQDQDLNIPIPNSQLTNYPITNSQTVYVKAETSAGCFDSIALNTIINPLPIIPIEDVVAICLNDLPLILDAYTGNPDDTYVWSTGETTQRIELHDPTQIGDYWVTATRSYPNADSCSFTKQFRVIESENATINFTTTVDFADPNSITVDVSGLGNYVFILDDGVAQQSNVFENVTPGLHHVTIRDLNGCDDVTTQVVVVDIPKFFTPNNDTFFDTWHIIGINEIPGTVIYIFNRYGKLLKTLPHTAIGWDGTYNGKNMPADDYWFLAKVLQDGKTFDIKGHFTLKR